MSKVSTKDEIRTTGSAAHSAVTRAYHSGTVANCRAVLFYETPARAIGSGGAPTAWKHRSPNRSLVSTRPCALKYRTNEMYKVDSVINGARPMTLQVRDPRWRIFYSVSLWLVRRSNQSQYSTSLGLQPPGLRLNMF